MEKFIILEGEYLNVDAIERIIPRGDHVKVIFTNGGSGDYKKTKFSDVEKILDNYILEGEI